MSPAPAYGADLAKIVEETIIQRTVDAMAKEGIPSRGFIYWPHAYERRPQGFGIQLPLRDPEAQVVIPVLKRI